MASLYFYCLSCGSVFQTPSRYKNCDKCHKLYKSNPAKRYNVCRKCNCSKEYNPYSLCLNCYYSVLDKNKKGHY